MRRCPTCRREVNWDESEWRPFCSQRCQQLDLGRWASEEYRIPISQPEIEEQFSSELHQDSDDE